MRLAANDLRMMRTTENSAQQLAMLLQLSLALIEEILHVCSRRMQNSAATVIHAGVHAALWRPCCQTVEMLSSHHILLCESSSNYISLAEQILCCHLLCTQ